MAISDNSCSFFSVYGSTTESATFMAGPKPASNIYKERNSELDIEKLFWEDSAKGNSVLSSKVVKEIVMGALPLPHCHQDDEHLVRTLQPHVSEDK